MAQSLIRLRAGLLPCLAVLLLISGVRADHEDNDDSSSGPFFLPTDCTKEAGHAQYVGVMYGLGRYARGVDELGTFSGVKDVTNPAFVTAIDNYMAPFLDNGLSINITLAGLTFSDLAAIRASAIARASGFHVRRHAFTAHQMWECPDDSVLVIFSGTIANGVVANNPVTGLPTKQPPALQLQKYTQVWVKVQVAPGTSLWKVRFSLPKDEFPAGNGNINRIAWNWPAPFVFPASP